MTLQILLTSYAHMLLRLKAQIIVSIHTTLMNGLSSINLEISSLRPSFLLQVILYGDKMLNGKSNHQILTATINYIKNTQRFEQALFKIFEGDSFYQLATCYSLFLVDILTV